MAMLKNKHITFSLVLVCLLVFSPMAKAQLGGLGGGLGGLGGLVGGIVGDLLNLISINGVLACTPNGSLNGTSAPAFANAGIQLQCGRQNTVVATTTTNSAGIFSFPTDLLNMVLSNLLSNCRLVVTTPLATCNAQLPSVGSLVSPLTFIGSSASGILNVVNVAPSGFQLIMN